MSTGDLERPEPPIVMGAVACGRFRIVRPQAGGGTAVTFRAEDTLTGEHVALKVARTATANDKTQFLDQATKISRLHSRSLPAYLGYFEHANGELQYPALCFEFVRGQPLGEYLSSNGEFECLEVLRLLAVALDELDQASMRHGDLTTDNVLVREHQPVLIDPDSTGRNSGETRHLGSDFGCFAGIVSGCKAGAAFPAMAQALSRIDRKMRPFRAAAAILKGQRQPVLVSRPAARLGDLRQVNRTNAADVQAGYANLLIERRSSFGFLARTAAGACVEIGITPDAVNAQQEQQDVSDELAYVAKPSGVMRSCTRTFRSHDGRKWTLQLLQNPVVTIARPFRDATVRAELSSAVHTHDELALIDERLRVRVTSDGQLSYEVSTLDGWAPLAEDWYVRPIEILVGARIPALATGHIPDDPDESGAGPTLAALRDQLEQDLETPSDMKASPSKLNARIHSLCEVHPLDRCDEFKRIFDDVFLPRCGSYFASIQLFDLVRIADAWTLEVAGTVVGGGRVAWTFPLPWLFPAAE